MNALTFFPSFEKAPVGRKKPKHLEEGEQVRGRSLHMWFSCPVWAEVELRGWRGLLLLQSGIPKLICLVFTEPLNYWAGAAKLLQSCPTLCNPIDGSPPGSPVPGILQARILEWVAFSFSNAWKWKVKGKSLSRVWLLATPWTAAYQVPLPMGFARQEYWSGVPLPSPSYWASIMW